MMSLYVCPECEDGYLFDVGDGWNEDEFDDEYHPSEYDDCPECGNGLISMSKSDGAVINRVDTCPICGWSDEVTEIVSDEDEK